MERLSKKEIEIKIVEKLDELHSNYNKGNLSMQGYINADEAIYAEMKKLASENNIDSRAFDIIWTNAVKIGARKEGIDARLINDVV